MNDYQLTEYAEDIARDILAEVAEYGGDATDLAHENADGSEHVIYYSKAHDICQNCNTENGEQFLEDMGGAGKDATYDSIATLIAYGELYSRIVDALGKIDIADAA